MPGSAGVHEFRDGGGTVLLGSHILVEAEASIRPCHHHLWSGAWKRTLADLCMSMTKVVTGFHQICQVSRCPRSPWMATGSSDREDLSPCWSRPARDPYLTSQQPTLGRCSCGATDGSSRWLTRCGAWGAHQTPALRRDQITCSLDAPASRGRGELLGLRHRQILMNPSGCCSRAVSMLGRWWPVQPSTAPPRLWFKLTVLRS